MGIAMTSSQGDSDYEQSGSGEERENGSIATSIAGAAPYQRWLGEGGLGIWGSAGAGSGDLELTTANDVTETGIGLTMLAAGAKKPLRGTYRNGLALRGDMFTVQTSADAAEGIDEVDAGATRARLALECVCRRDLDGCRSMVGHMELVARLDSGDGGSDAGADVAGEIRYAWPDQGLELAGRAGLLLLHSQSGFSEWSAGIEAAYAPGRSGLGLQMSLVTSWNVHRADAGNSLWSDAVSDLETSATGAKDFGA